MFTSYIRLAISKATPSQNGELQSMLSIAEEAERVETDFETKINASKAARGEGPTKLSKAKRAEVQGYADDAKELESEQLQMLANCDSADDVLRPLKAGLSGDLKFWRSSLKYVHPNDMPIVEEFIQARASLLKSIQDFLSR